MIDLTEHKTAVCPTCAETLYFGTKQETTSWKVYYECRACGWEQMADRIQMSEIAHTDELYEHAEAIGQRWEQEKTQ